MANSHIDRTQEFNDYALAFVQLKGGDLGVLSERIGVPVEILARRLDSPDFTRTRQQVLNTQMASTVARIKLRERQVDLVELMIDVALGEKKATSRQLKMLIALRDAVIPTDLAQATTRAADAIATTQTKLGESLAAHVETLQQLAPPKRTLDTVILSGADALPVASRLADDARRG